MECKEYSENVYYYHSLRFPLDMSFLIFCDLCSLINCIWGYLDAGTYRQHCLEGLKEEVERPEVASAEPYPKQTWALGGGSMRVKKQLCSFWFRMWLTAQDVPQV